MAADPTTPPPAGLPRRLAALFYDLLLVIALAFAATFAMLPLTGGEAILASTQGVVAHAYHAVLVLATFAYFGFSWTRSGQTLGLRAWRIALEAADGRRLGWTAAAARFLLGGALGVLAALGLGYLRDADGPLSAAGAAALAAPLVLNYAWVPFDRAGRSLMDVAGGARMRRL